MKMILIVMFIFLVLFGLTLVVGFNAMKRADHFKKNSLEKNEI